MLNKKKQKAETANNTQLCLFNYMKMRKEHSQVGGGESAILCEIKDN